MTWMKPEIIILGLLECLALAVIVRIWRKRRDRSVIARLAWSAILLVPVLGLLAYGFLCADPAEHPYDRENVTDGADSYDSQSGGH